MSLPVLVLHKKVGFVDEPNAESIGAAIPEHYEAEENYFISNIRTEKQKYPQSKQARTITVLTNGLHKKESFAYWT